MDHPREYDAMCKNAMSVLLIFKSHIMRECIELSHFETQINWRVSAPLLFTKCVEERQVLHKMLADVNKDLNLVRSNGGCVTYRMLSETGKNGCEF